MKKEKNYMLEYIIQKITPFLNHYPNYIGRLSSLFLDAIDLKRGAENKVYILSVLNIFEGLKFVIKTDEKNTAPSQSMFLFHNISSAALSLIRANKEEELAEIEKYFLELKYKEDSLESFLFKELRLKAVRHKYTDHLAFMLQALNDGTSTENFILEGDISISQLKTAAKKYFKEQGSTGETDDNYGFHYELKDRTGLCTITNGVNQVFISVC
jgi:hypothetical protein